MGEREKNLKYEIDHLDIYLDIRIWISSLHGTHKQIRRKQNGRVVAIVQTIIISTIHIINQRHNRIKHNHTISIGQITIIETIISNRELISSKVITGLHSRVIIRTQIDTMRTPTRTIINPKISEESNKCCNRWCPQFKIWLEQ